MERLHSKSTHLYGWFFLLIILIGLGTCVFCVFGDFGIVTLVFFGITVILLGVGKNFFLNLKCVFLDHENNKLVVKDGNIETLLDIAEIKSVETTNILRATFIIIHLKKDFYFGDQVIFFQRISILFTIKLKPN